MARALKTRCIHGHEYTPENTIHMFYGGKKSRMCRTCSQTHRRRRHLRSHPNANKVERLRIAGKVAPLLRRLLSPQRRVAVVDRDGTVVRHTTLAQVQQSMLRRMDIELDSTTGERPKSSVCQHCGKEFAVVRPGKIPATCPGGCVKACDCGAALSQRSSMRAARSGHDPKCRSCTAKERAQRLLAEGRYGMAKKTLEERSLMAKKAWETRRAKKKAT